MSKLLALMGALVALVASTTVHAQVVTCASPNDCDGDGILNTADACPAVAGNTAQPGPAGFSAIACYLPFIPTLDRCIPVAARPIDEFVSDDPYTPIGSGTQRRGFNYVGVFDRAAGGPAAAAPYLNQASPSSIGVAGGIFRSNTLFACIGSVEFNSDSTVKEQNIKVYGFRIASAYARSVNAAALRAQELGLPVFKDALGLIESVRDEGGRMGIVGTGGSWDNHTLWSTQSSPLVNLPPEELPRVEPGFPIPACIDRRIPVTPRVPFGPRPVMPAEIPRSMPSYVPRFHADEFVAPGEVGVVDFAGCTTTGPDEIYTFYSHLVIQLPSISLLFGITMPGGVIDLWWVDEPMVWPRATERLSLGTLDLKSRSKGQNPLREPRPRYGPWLATIATSEAEIAQLEGGNWTEIRGAAFSALKAADLDGRPLRFFSQTDTGASRSISATLLGWQVDFRRFDFAADHWIVGYSTGAGQPKQVNVTVPLAADPDNRPFPFEQPSSSAFMSMQFTPDQWHPQGDYWEANSSGRCNTLSQRFPGKIAPNPSTSVPDEWCPRSFGSSTTNVLESYAARIDRCNPRTADMSNADDHWPLLERRVPYATLFGHLVSKEAPTGKFPDGDLVYAGISNNGHRLHEGVDINWEMMEEFTDPTTRQVFGKYEPEHCWGELAIVGSLEMPISCSNPNIQLCGRLAGPRGADGCNPQQLAQIRWEREVGSCCRPVNCGGGVFDWFCTGISCIANCAGSLLTATIQYYTDIFQGYVGTICAAWNGSQPCFGSKSFVLHRGQSFPPGKRRMENELEYNVAFGVYDRGLQRQDDCAGNIGVTSTCDWHETNASYEHKNWVFVSEERDLVSVGTNKDGDFFSQFLRGLPLQQQVWPVVVGPGLFQSRRGVWGRMATIAGDGDPFAEYDAVPKLQVLSPDVLALLDLEPEKDHPFRMEMLGDLIVDCGHNPLRPEIHPPAGIYMHLGGPGRYSVFGWHRGAGFQGADAPLEIDLWPAKPKPHAGAQLALNVVYDQGIEAGSASVGGKWICSKYPAEAPDHFRCILAAEGRFANGTSPRDDNDLCDDNPRMLPSCEDGIAGGIVEVSWQ